MRRSVTVTQQLDNGSDSRKCILWLGCIAIDGITALLFLTIEGTVLRTLCALCLLIIYISYKQLYILL